MVFLGCVCIAELGRKWDLHLPMLVVFAVYWETTYLRWVTVDVKWWDDQSGKSWLFYLSALQISQGALLDRLVGELRQVLVSARSVACWQHTCIPNDHY